ncbi:MAG: site-2 protease family protein [Oscillospiraceae bacterium]|nr:site-2 protease family protein [Oscillospiraceae bacterium]
MLFDLLHGNLDQKTLIELLAHLVIIFLILPLHEMAHAWTAYKLGDDTASIQGRMTLNPIAHIDPFGALMLLFTGYGWAKPVPINPRRFDRKHSVRFGVAITALAGPVSNLLAAFIGMIVYRFYFMSNFFVSGWAQYRMNDEAMNPAVLLFYFLQFFITVNIGLALFNLIPIPPLDGSKIVSYFTPAKFDRWFIDNQQIVMIVFMIVVFSGILQTPLSWMSDQIWRLFIFMTDWVPKIAG